MARVMAENRISIEDINYFAFDLGGSGREALERLAADESFSDGMNRDQIRAALGAEDRFTWDDPFVDEERLSDWSSAVADGRVVPVPADAPSLSAQAAFVAQREIGLADATVPDPVLIIYPEPSDGDLFVLIRRSDSDLLRTIMTRDPIGPEGEARWSVFLRSNVSFASAEEAKAAFERAKEEGVAIERRMVPVVTIAGEAVSPYELRYNRSVPPSLLEVGPTPAPDAPEDQSAVAD